MKNYITIFIYLFPIVAFLTACTEDKHSGGNDSQPTISFDAPEDVYTVKVGEKLWLEPVVTNNRNASYRWLQDGEVIGTEIILLFSSPRAGRFFLTFEVTAGEFMVDKEIRIDVADFLPPIITLPVPDGGYILPVGHQKEFVPVVSNSVNARFEWSIDGMKVADTKDYIFKAEEIGEYSALLMAANDEGQSEVAFHISVRSAEDSFSWEWEKDRYIMKAGRTIMVGPFSVVHAFDATFTWTLGQQIVQETDAPEYLFTPAATGTYELTLTMENSYMTATHTITVEAFDREDETLRTITASSRSDADKVWEFLPAPGQFVNEHYTANDMEQACRYAEDRFQQTAYVSLGAFGGYIVVGFDHSIINDGGYNLQVLGNSFDGSSEPGIVWVMQDENGDGKPNDTWYELKGSEFGKPGTIAGYSVTYYKPSGPSMDVAWTDNFGNSGTIDYLAAYHKQDYYYPNWVKTGSYTLRGTRLEARTVDLSGDGSYWYNGNFDWGYADNFSPIDRLTDDDNHNAGVNANHFRISDAVDQTGREVELKYIDFVKIQTGVQSSAGWLGENSTEVFGLRDYNMIKGKQ